MKNKDFFLIILIIIPIESSDKCIFNDNDKAFRDNNFWMITNFNSLESLYFNCSKPVNMSMWGFKPNIPLILDNSLNIKILKIQSENEAFAFILENFKGFDIKSNHFREIFTKFGQFHSQMLIFIIKICLSPKHVMNIF